MTTSRSIASKRSAESAQKPSTATTLTEDLEDQQSDYEDAKENADEGKRVDDKDPPAKFVCKCKQSLYHRYPAECVIQQNWNQHVDLVAQ